MCSLIRIFAVYLYNFYLEHLQAFSIKISNNSLSGFEAIFVRKSIKAAYPKSWLNSAVSIKHQTEAAYGLRVIMLHIPDEILTKTQL